MNVPIPVQLAGLLGSENVVPPEQASNYAIDGVSPEGIARPGSREQAAELLRWASSGNLTVFPRGGGIHLGIGNIPEGVDVALDLSRLNSVIDYQAADMTVTVEAGITLEALQTALAVGGQLVPLESPLAGQATVGGVLSVGASGPLAHTYGPPRDWLIGLGVVNADGTETKSGGKVVKNVTGYDLNKLYTGSLGTLAVIVEATFKLSPRPPESGALAAAFPSLETSIEAGRKLLRDHAAPLGLQCLTAGMAQSVWDNASASGQATVFAHYAGRARATNRRLQEGAALLSQLGASTVDRLDGPGAEIMLKRLSDLGRAPGQTPAVVIKLAAAPHNIPELAAACSKVQFGGSLPEVAVDPGFSSIRLFWMNDIPRTPDAVVDAVFAVRSAAQGHGGSAMVEQCPTEVKRRIDVWGGEPQGIEIMRRIKEKFDPGRVLNPGRFVGRI